MEKAECIHWWILTPNIGLESQGVCKKCNESRIFPNWTWIDIHKRYNDPVNGWKYTKQQVMQRKERTWSLRKLGVSGY